MRSTNNTADSAPEYNTVPATIVAANDVHSNPVPDHVHPNTIPVGVPVNWPNSIPNNNANTFNSDSIPNDLDTNDIANNFNTHHISNTIV